MASFVQLIDYRTTHPQAVDDLLSRWITETAGLRTARRTRVGRDVQDPTHYIEILEFDSPEDAAINSGLPRTQATHEEFLTLCSSGPTFTDLTIVRDEQL